MRGNFYDSPVHVWSGLLSGNNYTWQEGLRIVAANIGDASFHSSMSGYDGWEKVAASAVRRQVESIVLIGHSNGGYAITKCAAALKPHGIKAYLVCFDRTMKRCPALGANVPEALDLYAGLRNLESGPDFVAANNTLTVVDFSEESHIGVIGNEHAQRLATAFGKRWKPR